MPQRESGFGLRGDAFPSYTALMMAVRFFLFALFLFVEYSLGAATALAVKRPGAPRPLRAQAAGEVTTHQSDVWMNGIAPIAAGNELRFTRDDALARGEVAVRVDDADNKSAWSLTSRSLFSEQLRDPRAISPDGRRRAFASARLGLEAVYVAAVNAPETSARRVATLARNPVWLDASTLLYESTRPGHQALYKISVPSDASAAPPTPQLWFEKAGEATVSPDRQSVCVAARDEHDQSTQLYLLAADGSGARAIAGTSGARRPCFSVSGDEIYFDAPAPREEGSASSASASRVIWMIPLVSTPPAAQLIEVRPTASGGAEIYGTAFSEAGRALDVRLEIGRSDDAGDDVEASWKKIETRPAPIHGGVLALWQPTAADQHANLQLRLTVTDADGDHAQSTLAFNWPPPPLSVSNPTPPPLFATQPELYGLGTALPASPAPSTAADSAPPRSQTLPLPAPPEAVPTPRVTGALRLAPAPAPAARPALAANPVTVVRPVRATPVPVRVLNHPQVVPQPQPVKAQAAKKAPPRKAPPRKMQASPNSGGIPAVMKVGSSVPVTVVLRNTGSRSWSSTGSSPVRLIYRWVDVRTNIRHYWAVKWLRETVPPGASTRLKFDLEAPSRAGDFILTYALVRLNSQNYDGKKYLPPPARSEDQRWPGEFGAVSFRIKVTP
jgi:hypothetical protein